ncbi:MAG TPA: bifunctional Delta(1)-pyrroline-2-carboxylate/Delta(1)-piperideine-2-carboxylate reductase [Trinickia sp.]|uniref:bifunctional Delta(1)-pyrroline-2-carboxylate/Delta(1)-piperideine-2- carboxylate reductase n=1 Tax=Trinickia sp. TaxID=2571163 RepID=UPI002BFB3044|nr:bifunctional Delta(1)-pyrroline-2-carboxylate/Delta(1)-piperideine-2-carboxylate reductase [Trinickia sp.]HVW50156.1 bifunctional Delta(1)-pyrroline-2-carboxylate/Delta(1)-piperideine-2-carboxylate reductase [Trinickia sp.]
MTMQFFDAAATARLTPFPALVDALAQACVEAARGEIASPARLVVPLNRGGTMLSMPAAARDLAIHKLVTVCPVNRERSLPTIHGHVSVCDPDTGEALLALDGPTATGRRTAAVTLLAMRTFSSSAPGEILLVGTGTQAAHHVHALASVYPGARVRVRGSSLARAKAFCEEHGHLIALSPMTDAETLDSFDAVITLTTSRAPVYDEPARHGRLVIGVGAFTPEMAEIGARTLEGSRLYVDDLAGAKHEAGDFIQAGVDWARVNALADVLAVGATAASSTGVDAEPVVFKSVGCAAWDLAACRVARQVLG